MKNELFITIGLCTLPFSSTLIAKTQNPNIIVILVDDLGYGDLSCQKQATDILTPNIDKLLTEGIHCRNFHSNCPVSSPSRASLLTGLFPDKVGVPGVIRTYPEDSWGYLSESSILVPQLLKKKRYDTALIGKWHLGLETPNMPNNRGFDYFYGFLGDMMDDYYTHLRCGNNYMRKNEREIDPKGHATEIFSDEAIRYVTERKQQNDPFFLFLSYNAPHTPIQPPTEWVDKVEKRQPGITKKRAKLVALIEHLDENIGRLYRTLEQNGQLENTLIVFASDNGGQVDAGANNAPHRGTKQNMYEGGICVPGGFYWKGTIQPAANDNFMMLSDIFPTLCDLTDVKIDHKIDGISILPILQGRSQVTDDRLVYWVRREGNFSYGGQAYYAARYKNYKLLQNTPWEPLLFFDLEADPKEENPITERSSDMYKKLFNGLMEHIRIAGATPWQKAE